MSVSIRSTLAKNSGRIRLCEVHDRHSTEIVRDTVGSDGQHMDGVWIGGLCQTTFLGVPDTELISPLQRAVLIALNGNLEQKKTRRPLCAAFDADSGGSVADIPALVAVTQVMGVSMLIIEDKALSEPGQKVNSLKESSGNQAQADMYEFADIIRAFKSASANKDMMITARIENFTVRKAKADEAEERASVQESLQDALTRAEVYHEAGVDAIMIHSKSKNAGEVLSFLTEYRSRDPVTPLVVVPTTYSATARSELYDAGANVVIYANHLMRAKIQAVSKISDDILAVKPGLLAEDEELSACLDARNYGSLLRKLAERRFHGEETKEEAMYRVVAETYAGENMKAVVKDLLEGELSGCEADERIISAKELLKINAQHVSAVEEVMT